MATDKNDPIDETEDSTPSTPPPGMVNMNDFAAAIGGAVASALESRDSKNKKVTFGEYQRRLNATRVKLTREVYQNGYRLNAQDLNNEQIELLNRISRTGRYIDRKIEVILREDGADQIVEFRYNNKSADQRMELRGYIRNFTDMLTQVVEAQDKENVEQEEREGRRNVAPVRRPFGSSKTTEAARTAAGV